MARPATGSPRWNATLSRWEARVTLIDGSRKPVAMSGVAPCANGTPMHDAPLDCEHCSHARRRAQLLSNQARELGCVPVETAETWSEWHVRYLEAHERLGKQTREMKGAGRKWVADRIGTIPIVEVKREHVVAIRDGLTRAVIGKEISAKRAMNVYSDIVVAPFSRAFTDDDPRYSAVRVGPFSANPAAGIKPPVTKAQLDEDKRSRQPMYPREFLLYITCVAVAVAARRIAALACYLYCRPQEIFALRWTDVDWAAQEIRVRRKLDVRTGEEKPGTKSDAGIREIPIHPSLMPLLVAMHEQREHDGARLLPLVGAARFFERFADETRRNIKIAGIERTELVTGTEDLMPFDFRSWRTTGCTWLAMLGTDSYVIAQQAGHKSPDTTWASYIKRGPDLRQRHGEPFPPLPAELLEHGDSHRHSSLGFVLAGRPKHPRKIEVSGGEGGIRTSSKNVADRRVAAGPGPSRAQHDSPGDMATEHVAESGVGSAVEATVLVETRRPEPEPEREVINTSVDPDAELRAAIKSAIDQGDLTRAGALLRVLQASPKPAPVVDLASRRGR